MKSRFNTPRSLKIAVIGATASLFFSCGETSNSDLSIVGGREVPVNSSVVNSTAALVNSSGQTFCTASLITRRHLVTAAHCLVKYTDRKIFVVFGVKSAPNRVAKADVRIVNYFKIHPDFSFESIRNGERDTAPSDIAFLQMSRDAPLFTKPVVVLKKRDKIYRGEPLLLAGFGKPRFDIHESGVLREVFTKLDKINYDMKEIVYGWTPGKGACKGDSGGPAFVSRKRRLALVGVTSRGPASCNSTGTYTDIRQFRGWLGSEIQYASRL